MRFKATEDQIKQIAVNAVKASSPMGLGHFAHNPHQVFIPDDFKLTDFGMSLDYIQGRMVKLHIKRIGDNQWEALHKTATPDPEYQSWIKTYPTFKDLAESAGVDVSG